MIKKFLILIIANIKISKNYFDSYKKYIEFNHS